MNAINVTAVTPAFMTLLFGTAAICIALAIATVLNWGSAGSALLLAASLIYVVGVIVVTIVFNVPLNDALAATTPESAARAELWTRYLSVWVGWNHVRLLAPLVSTALFIAALR